MLKVSGLKVFYGDVQVLFDISLQIKEGEFISVVGANAAGKSTLLRAISGLLRKTSGSIEFQGRPLIGKPPYEIVESGIVHIPEGRRVFPLLSVRENLEVGAYVQKSRVDLSQSLREVYDFFPQLYEHRNQLAGSLSGGEQQMLAIGRGLMSKPKLLLFDEPSWGLSPLLSKVIYEVIGQINHSGMTILLIEQNVRMALELANRAYVVENGRIVKQGDSRNMLNDQHIREAYLGTESV